MSPVAVDHHLRRLRLAATTAHVIPPITIDLVAADGRVRRIGSTPRPGPISRAGSSAPSWPRCGPKGRSARWPTSSTYRRRRSACGSTSAAGTSATSAAACTCCTVAIACGLVFVTLLDGERTRAVTGAVARPGAADASCPALQAMAAVGPVEVMVDQQTDVTVVYCDQEHPAGLPVLESYGQALFSACAVAELLDEVG
jgi:hypothetical protein